MSTVKQILTPDRGTTHNHDVWEGIYLACNEIVLGHYQPRELMELARKRIDVIPVSSIGVFKGATLPSRRD